MSVIKDLYEIVKDWIEIYGIKKIERSVFKAIANGKIGKCAFCGGLIDKGVDSCKHCYRDMDSMGCKGNYIIEIDEESACDKNEIYYIGKYSEYRRIIIYDKI